MKVETANALYTLAYPTLTHEDREWIEGLRRQHDPQAGLVPLHFTLVFACQAVNVSDYLAHVEPIARATREIEFTCRSAMLDEHEGRAYVYLVPDEGRDQLALLHDKLYTEVLAEHLRHGTPFIPHITIGSSKDKSSMARLHREVSMRPLAVHGVVNELTLVLAGDGQIEPVRRIGLADS